MSKILLIVLYFGKLPTYFPLWLKSVKMNSTIDFLLVTDDNTKYNYPENVKVVYKNFSEIKNKIQSIFEFKTKLNTPYKLCDYKPFYNLIFEEEVKDYDFWGFCDIDLIFGNIRKFITDKILNNYDKIYTRGHMTILRNSSKINNILKSENNNYECYNYKEALATNYVCHFDEWGGISKICETEEICQYDKIDFADVYVNAFDFKILFIESINNKTGIFKWDNGDLYFITKDGVEQDFIYAHFQKRNMEMHIHSNEYDKFIIVPNKFIDYCKIDINFVNENSNYNKACENYYKKRINVIINNIKNGAIGQRIYRLKKKIKKGRDKKCVQKTR